MTKGTFLEVTDTHLAILVTINGQRKVLLTHPSNAGKDDKGQVHFKNQDEIVYLYLN